MTNSERELRKALEEARHELVILGGLYATDRPELFKFEEHPSANFRIDTTAAIAKISTMRRKPSLDRF
jgi:hypothetical protein